MPPLSIYRPVLGAHPNKHSNTRHHENDAEDEKELAGLPGQNLDPVRNHVSAGAPPSTEANPDLLEAVAMGRQAVQPHTLDAGNQDGEEGKDEAAEPKGADKPGLVPTVGKHIRPGAGGA